MKFSFFASLAIFACTIGQTQTKSASGNTPGRDVVTLQAALPAAPGNTLLWKISGNGLTRPSYLFGTMHLLCADDIHLSEAFKKIISGSDLIYFEVDMDNMLEIMGSLRYLKMSDNKKLSDLLTPEEYTRVAEYFSKNQSMLPFAMLESFKPFFISSLLSEQGMDCASKEGMEQAIMNEAKTSEKEIKGLETIQFQASVFDSIPYERQAKELVKAIDSASIDVNETKELAAVYKDQDLQKIQEMTVKEDGVLGEFIDLLLYNRNADWAKKMKNLMPANSILFAVGAAHLPGEKGVINLLKKQGYTLTPLQN